MHVCVRETTTLGFMGGEQKKNACITTITTNKPKQPHEQNFDG